MERFWQWSRDQQGCVVFAALCTWSFQSRQGSAPLSIRHKQFVFEGTGDFIFLLLSCTLKVLNCTFILKLKRKHISLWFCRQNLVQWQFLFLNPDNNLILLMYDFVSVDSGKFQQLLSDTSFAASLHVDGINTSL